MLVDIIAKDEKLNISMKSYNYDLWDESEILINKIEEYFDLGFDTIEIRKGYK
jgi:hypothetical protein